MSWLSRSGSHPPIHRATSPPRPPSLFVVRSSDGAEFGLAKDDFKNISTLDELRFNLLSPLLEIPPDCLILMNEEGSPLNRDEAVQHLALLAGTPASSTVLPSTSGLIPKDRGLEKRIYVFDREHLDADPEEVAKGLAVTEEMVLGEPPLEPQDPLPSHLSLSHHNLTTLRALISSIHLQHSSLALALSNLHRVNTGTSSSFTLFLDSANPAMERYERLLGGWEGAMDAVGKVAVVAGFLARGGSGGTGGSGITGHGREGSSVSAVGTAGGGGTGAVQEKQRFLGDYVSRDKMLAVRDGCAKVLAELKLRTEGLQATLNDVISSTDAVQADLEVTSNDLQDLEACEQDAEQGHLRIEELVQAGEQMSDPELVAQCFEELSICDAEHRERIRFLVERKNAMTRYLLLEMQKISTLQSDIANMPGDLGALDHDLRTRTDNFKHLARLEGLIPAYVATVAEVVRRREYARLLQTQFSTLSATLAPLNDAERTRRAHYRTTFSGKLPWEVRGLSASSEQVPQMALAIELKGQEALPDLRRETLDELKNGFEKLYEEIGEVPEENPVRQARELLQGLVRDVVELSREFEQISLNPPPPRPPSLDPARLSALEAQIRTLEEQNDTLSRQLQTERSSREEEIVQLEARCSAAEGASTLLRSRNEALEQDKVSLDKARRDASSRADGVQQALSLEMERRERIERDLSTTKAAESELKKQWLALDGSHTRLQGELGTIKMDLVQARMATEEHEAELKTARSAQKDLTLALAEKDRLLRDQQSEAELDRAVLEKTADELRKAVAARDDEVEAAQSEARAQQEMVEGLREQVARWEQVTLAKDEDVEAAKKELEDAKRDREKGIVDVQKEVVKMTGLAREAVTLAGRLRDENNNITEVLNTPPPSKGDPAATTELDKIASPSLVLSTSTSSPSFLIRTSSVVPPLDYAAGDLEDLLAELAEYSHEALTDAVKNKIDSLTAVTKKWVKEAKAYRERANRAASATNDKIAFRNFTKGDLALFLPTRNSAVPVWAAFNVSFPHHFLSATGVIAEQMKTREWIVARITSLTEKVVDPKDPLTNPYLLAAGTKYFTLEVEAWSSKESSRSRRHSAADKLKSSSGEKKSSKEMRASRASESSAPIRSTSTSTTDSAILVNRPAVSASSPGIRRTVSESGPLPPNATLLARSEYAIVEADEDQAESRTPSPPALAQKIPKPEKRLESPTTTPSGLARALARSSTPSSPTGVRSQPFPPCSPSPNPFSSGSPSLDSPLQQPPTPPVTDYDPSHSTIGAAPAFLPSSGKKAQSSAGSAAGSSIGHSPRYIRSSARPIASARSSPHRHPNPGADLLSASPASTSASSVNVISQPRSVSSGSSILSSSMHRRAASSILTVGGSGVSPPPVPGGKAPSTQEAQLTGSRWNLLQEGLSPRASNRTTASSSKSGSDGVSRVSPSQQPKPTSSAVASTSPSSLDTPRPPAMSSSASSTSIFDMFKGRKASGAPPGDPSGRMRRASSSVSGSAGGAEGEIRKLLGQPPF
ncbi:hypothetical protein JCM11641_006854 [Rhodosporidiobolus odoratus]